MKRLMRLFAGVVVGGGFYGSLFAVDLREHLGFPGLLVEAERPSGRYTFLVGVLTSSFSI